MLSFKYVGLGCYSFAITAANKLNESDIKTMDRIYLTKYDVSFGAILDILEFYHSRPNQEKTFYWARLLNEKCFQSVSSKNKPELTYLFAMITTGGKT